jgi:hypothetical protein
MKGLGQHDVQHINRTYRRTGTLFEGRFRSENQVGESDISQCISSASPLDFEPFTPRTSELLSVALALKASA